MKKILTWALALVFVSGSAIAADYQEGEVIVKYRDGSFRVNSLMQNLYEHVGVEAIEYHQGIFKDFETLTLKEGVTVQEAIDRLQQDPMVEYAQPNFILSIPVNEGFKMKQDPPPGGIPLPCIPGIIEPPMCDPNATMPCLFPGIPFPPGCTDNPGGGNPGNPGKPSRPDLKDPPGKVDPPVVDPDMAKIWGISKIQAPEAWKTHRGSKEFVVAVIDTGIDYNHEDLAFNVWRNPKPTNGDITGYDFIHNDGMPFDDQGHGTHCAGTVGAVGDNGKGVSGVNQNISIMALKFLSSSGSGQTSDAIKAIDYAIKNGAKVLSNSWGGGYDPNNKALSDAIDRAKDANILFIAAAGNDSSDNDKKPTYPAAFENENLIAVAATDSNDKLAFFSNYGAKSVDIAAPGHQIYSTVPGDKYTAHSGTSMACPHVAGAAALIWSRNPSWDFKKVKDVLLNSVDQLDSLKGKVVTGGRLNVLKALQSTD